MAECAILEPTGDPERDVRTLVDSFIHLMPRFWEARGREWYGVPDWDVQAVQFTHAWMTGGLAVILAREGPEPAGFLLGAHIRPLLHAGSVFEVEAYYGITAAAEEGLLDYLKEALKFFSERFVSLPDYGDGRPGGRFALRQVRKRGVYRK